MLQDKTLDLELKAHHCGSVGVFFVVRFGVRYFFFLRVGVRKVDTPKGLEGPIGRHHLGGPGMPGMP